jgi:hypothetical protein
MRRWSAVKTMTMTNTTPITRVRIASPQAADRGINVWIRDLTVGVPAGLSAPVHKAIVIKDVASRFRGVHLRSRRPPDLAT